jgi:hypothetical protein
MGERKKAAFRVGFDSTLRLEFHGVRVTSDAGLLPYRELDDTFGLTKMGEAQLKDTRTGMNRQHMLVALLRQSIFSRLAGYEDTNDADRLRVDPAMRYVVGGRATEKTGASTSEMSRFETEILTQPENLAALMEMPGRWVKRVQIPMKMEELILDMDSSESPTHGEQEGSAFNGHFDCTCYHPLFVFNQFGDLERCQLREGNVHSADDWRSVLGPVVERYRDVKMPKYFRGDAAFAQPEVYEYLEAEGYEYTMRIPNNDILLDKIDRLFVRPVWRNSEKPVFLYHSFNYKAGTWKKERRVVAKVEWHCDELIPRVGFIVTNMSGWSYNVVEFYNGRGTAEQWIKEGKNAIHWTKLSCHDFKDNQVRLQLFALAYNLGNFLRTWVLPKKIAHWSMTTLREKLIKIGAKVVRHARAVVFQMAEVAVPRDIFGAILKRIGNLRIAFEAG